MKNKLFKLTGFIACIFSANAFADQSVISGITDNVMKVCNKPEDAGKYWDMKIKGNGDAKLKLKLAKLGISGGAEFSKGEWQGIKNTIENNKDYRECVKKLAPIFIEKFTPIFSNTQNKKKENKRILGGLKWVEFGLGIEMTLDSCVRKSSSVSCIFYANAIDYDLLLTLYGSSAIYDESGRKYNANFVSIANFQSALAYSGAELVGELIKKINTKIVIRFSDVYKDAKKISKAMVKSYIQGKNTSGEYSYEFRNINIRI